MLLSLSRILRCFCASGRINPWKVLNSVSRTSKYQHSVCLYSNTPNTDVEPMSGLPFVDKNKGRLVYSGPLTKLIKGVKIFSLSSSAIGLSIQPLILTNAAEMSVVPLIAVGGMVNFFIFITPMLIHFISKKYVSVCYYDQVTGRFTATTFTLFLRKKDHCFTANDVHVPDVPGMFTSIKARGVPLFFDEEMFFDKNVYIHMLGYDKPIDWKIPNKEVKNGRDKL